MWTNTVILEYRITNEDENFLLWGEEKVADINTILHSWPDRNLSSCCEGLDKGQLTINVVVKTIPDTVETKTFSLPAEQEGNAEASGVNGPWANEKYNPVQEALHDRLRRQIGKRIRAFLWQCSRDKTPVHKILWVIQLVPFTKGFGAYGYP